MKVRFTCPDCGQLIEASGEVVGTAVTCPTCNIDFQVQMKPATPPTKESPGSVTCQCGKTYSVPRPHFGRSIRCHMCGRQLGTVEPAPKTSRDSDGNVAQHEPARSPETPTPQEHNPEKPRSHRRTGTMPSGNSRSQPDLIANSGPNPGLFGLRSLSTVPILQVIAIGACFNRLPINDFLLPSFFGLGLLLQIIIIKRKYSNTHTVRSATTSRSSNDEAIKAGLSLVFVLFAPFAGEALAEHIVSKRLAKIIPDSISISTQKPTRGEPYLRGKVIMIDKDEAKVAGWHFNLPCGIRALYPEEVGTAILLSRKHSSNITTEIRTYEVESGKTVGTQDCRIDEDSFEITIIDLAQRQVLASRHYSSTGKGRIEDMRGKGRVEDMRVINESPKSLEPEIMSYISGLPQRY